MSIELSSEILSACAETVYMVLSSGLIAVIFGIGLGIILFSARQPYLWGNEKVVRLLEILINAFRSIPFIILMVVCIPVTRWIVGTSIGTTAAIVPLSLAAIPFMARLVDNAFNEVDYGLIEAGLSMGATNWQVIKYILLVEGLPGVIQGISMTLINLIAYSAMAGAVGGGELGDLAIRYGYQRFNIQILLITTLILIFLSQATQQIGHLVLEKIF